MYYNLVASAAGTVLTRIIELPLSSTCWRCLRRFSCFHTSRFLSIFPRFVLPVEYEGSASAQQLPADNVRIDRECAFRGGTQCPWDSMKSWFTLLWASSYIISILYWHPHNLAPFQSEAHSVVLVRVPEEEIHVLVEAPQKT